jgi:hypothetical protein
MIKYRFKIGVTSQVASFENDEQAKEYAQFIGAEWERDTIICKFDKDDLHCRFEIDLSQIKDINTFEIKNMIIWKT